MLRGATEGERGKGKGIDRKEGRGRRKERKHANEKLDVERIRIQGERLRNRFRLSRFGTSFGKL